MLERVAVHQTRLRTPGLGLDARGVALGSKGVVLLPSIDRLVAFLALYTRQGSLADILRSLTIEVVRSKLGAREVTLMFAAETSDRMDRIAEIARLAGGYTFTGTSRHFVQYRDAAAPFGYDVPQISAGDAPLWLYHNSFSQSYSAERKLDVRQLILRLEPHTDPSAGREPGERWLAAEAGLGPAMIHYFVRSAVNAEVGVAEWPPESSFEDGPVVRYLFRIPALPERMLPLLSRTPGLTMFVPAAPGAAVECGFRHPVNLRACPVFSETGLVMFRGQGRDPLEIPTLPAFGDVRAFARVEMREEKPTPVVKTLASSSVSVALRLVATVEPWRSVTATWVDPSDLPVLRRIAYALGPETMRAARVAFTNAGAVVRHHIGIESIPVGQFYRRLHDNLYAPAGYDVVPAVSPDVLYRSLGAPPGQILFLRREGDVVAIPEQAFVPLESAVLEAQAWIAAGSDKFVDSLTSALATELPIVTLGGVGIRPLRDVEGVDAQGGT
jgi:FtsH ternary system domain X7